MAWEDPEKDISDVTRQLLNEPADHKPFVLPPARDPLRELERIPEQPDPTWWGSRANRGGKQRKGRNWWNR